MSENSNNGGGWQSLQVILSLATLISVIVFLSKIFGKGKEDQEHDDTEAKARRSRDLLYLQYPPTYPEFRYRDMADILDKALLRDSTEDEDAVYGVMEKMKNVSDVSKVIDAFGHRRQMFTTYYISLPQAIQYLNKREKKKINDILAGKKIDYSFD